MTENSIAETDISSSVVLNGVVITPSGRMVCADTGADLNDGYAHYMRMEYMRIFGHIPEGHPEEVTVQFFSMPADWDATLNIHYFTAIRLDRSMRVSIYGSFNHRTFIAWMTTALQRQARQQRDVTTRLH